MRRLFLLTMVLLMILASVAAGSELEKKTLDGISGFYVEADVNPGNSALRLRDADVQNDVEMVLRKAQIPVFLEGELMGDSLWNAATVHISIEAQADTMHTEKGCLFAHYILDVRQNARLERDTTVMAPTVTWRVTGFELCRAGNAAQQVRQAIADAAGKLVADFRQINPLE